MRQIMGLLLLVGAALLFLSIAAGPWFLYSGMALAAAGLLALLAIVLHTLLS